MINVAICDDVVSTTGKIETMLQNIAKRNFMPVDTDVFWKGEHLVDSVEMGNSFDIIFLDIEMGQEDGITVARRIRKIDKSVLIVYVTSHENYMMESFEIRPFRFLVKPVSREMMERCLQAAYEEISSTDSYFRYSYQRINHKIPIEQNRCAMACQGYGAVFLYTLIKSSGNQVLQVVLLSHHNQQSNRIDIPTAYDKNTIELPFWQAVLLC